MVAAAPEYYPFLIQNLQTGISESHETNRLNRKKERGLEGRIGNILSLKLCTEPLVKLRKNSGRR